MFGATLPLPMLQQEQRADLACTRRSSPPPSRCRSAAAGADQESYQQSSRMAEAVPAEKFRFVFGVITGSSSLPFAL